MNDSDVMQLSDVSSNVRTWLSKNVLRELFECCKSLQIVMKCTLFCRRGLGYLRPCARRRGIDARLQAPNA